MDRFTAEIHVNTHTWRISFTVIYIIVQVTSEIWRGSRAEIPDITGYLFRQIHRRCVL